MRTDLGRQLERHASETIIAIRSGRTDVVERRVDAHVGYVRKFVESLRRLGVEFDKESARRASGFEWPLLNQFDTIYYRMMEAATFTLSMSWTWRNTWVMFSTDGPLLSTSWRTGSCW